MSHSYQKTLSLLIAGGLLAVSISCCAGVLMGGLPQTAMAQPCHDAMAHTATLPQASTYPQMPTGIHGQLSVQLILLFTLIIASTPLLWRCLWPGGTALYLRQQQKSHQRVKDIITIPPLYRLLLAQGILHPKIF
jgi:hypothetical protein